MRIVLGFVSRRLGFGVSSVKRMLRRLVTERKLVLSFACIATVAGQIVLAIVVAPESRGQPAVIAPSRPAVVSQLQQSASAPAESAQPAPGSKPKFDVASVKPCARADDTPAQSRGGGGASVGGMEDSPGRLRVNCMTVLQLVENAYTVFGSALPVNNGSILHTAARVRGGPAWVQSDRYAIEAKTSDPSATGSTMGRTRADFILMGSMLQSLLEDRFQLKIHVETEQIPMYALTIAKSGLKLKPAEEGSCTPLQAGRGGMRRIGLDDKPYCNWFGRGINGPNRTLFGDGTFSKLAQALGLDRLVVDQTGITTAFNIRMEYAADESTPCNDPRCATDPTSDIPGGLTIFTALERLGLKLEPIKGSRGYLVIDHVERPSEN